MSTDYQERYISKNQQKREEAEKFNEDYIASKTRKAKKKLSRARTRKDRQTLAIMMAASGYTTDKHGV